MICSKWRRTNLAVNSLMPPYVVLFLRQKTRISPWERLIAGGMRQQIILPLFSPLVPSPKLFENSPTNPKFFIIMRRTSHQLQFLHFTIIGLILNLLCFIQDLVFLCNKRVFSFRDFCDCPLGIVVYSIKEISGGCLVSIYSKVNLRVLVAKQCRKIKFRYTYYVCHSDPRNQENKWEILLLIVVVGL